ncbi:MAG: DEAD/DEAH box helicase, partial [Candidatus Hadarchaeales archaeon]
MALNPIEVTERIRDYYLRYLRTFFPIQDEELNRKFRKELESECLIKGPYLEVTPGYKTGKSVAELIEEGVLHPAFKELDHEDHFPLNRPLYKHQEMAVRKVVTEGRNLIIATGTGSGKTESFLIPILDHLFREREAGTLKAGVRALILYPMNALANDQIKRLRQILSRVPDITFGRYIGQTPQEQKDAEANFREIFPGEPRIPNELISREEMLNNPPHILLTNYAMLEYLLIRPREHIFFAQDQVKTWRFIVLDEAHIYTGAKGTEMGYLLRRLKERVVNGEKGRLRCIATSATLGRGSEDYPSLAEFASQLFDEPFAYLPDDETRQDVVGAALDKTTLLKGSEEVDFWEPEPGFYIRLKALIETEEPDIISFLEMENIPYLMLKNIEKECCLRSEGPRTFKNTVVTYRIDGFLYTLLLHDGRLNRLITSLSERPLDLAEAKRVVFPDVEDGDFQALTSLVELACRARGVRRLLPARYHLFVRAVEGAYISLAPEQRIFLHRRKVMEEEKEGERWRVFELAVCINCGSHFLAGRIVKTSANISFEEAPLYDILDEEEEGTAFFYVLPEKHTVIPDEDELESEKYLSTERHRLLCAKCGTLSSEGAERLDCSCEEKAIAIKGLLIEKGHKGWGLSPCCSVPMTSIRRFVSRHDPTCAVLGTAFYQSIAREEQDIPESGEKSTGHMYKKAEEDTWSFAFSPEAKFPDERRITQKRYLPSRLLIFSDNRQDAAFFACFFEESYMRFLRRRLIAHTVSSRANDMMQANWGIEDLADQLALLADEHGLFPKDLTQQKKRIEARKWVMAELLRVERRNNLEELGFLIFDYEFRYKIKNLPEGFTKTLGLSDNEAMDVLCILINTMRERGAIKFPDGVSHEDEYFYPKNRKCFFRMQQSKISKGIFSWAHSSSNVSFRNKRLDFLMRLMERLHRKADQEKCEEILKKLWLALTQDESPFVKHGYIERVALSQEGHVYQLSPSIFRVIPGNGNSSLHWFRCDKCGKLTTLNVLGVCPSTHGCQGTLKPCDPHEELVENHYYRLYKELRLIPMKVQEHTAQLTALRAGELQQQFV